MIIYIYIEIDKFRKAEPAVPALACIVAHLEQAKTPLSYRSGPFGAHFV